MPIEIEMFSRAHGEDIALSRLLGNEISICSDAVDVTGYDIGSSDESFVK